MTAGRINRGTRDYITVDYDSGVGRDALETANVDFDSLTGQIDVLTGSTCQIFLNPLESGGPDRTFDAEETAADVQTEYDAIVAERIPAPVEPD